MKDTIELVVMKPEVAMDIVRSKQSHDLIANALERYGNGNLVNVSFMITPDQKEIIKLLARDNRMSQGVILRVILNEWMEFKMEAVAG